MWKTPKSTRPAAISVAPNGESLAFTQGPNLAAGSFGSVVQIMDGRGSAIVPVPGAPFTAFTPPGVALDPEEMRTRPTLIGLPSWTSDSRYVYVARGNGQLRRYDIQASSFEDLPFRGDTPAPLPTDQQKIVFVRSHARVKLDVPGQLAGNDSVEVVMGDWADNSVRGVVPASTSTWTHLAVSPDSKRLALVSERGFEGQQLRRWRVFVMDLNVAEPMPVSPPAAVVGPVCWTPDGKSLVYARSQEPLPFDTWDAPPNRQHRDMDLFHYDLTTNRETRLSRGGGFFSPSVSADQTLFYLAWQADENGRELRLRKVPLVAAREFAAKTPDPGAPSARAWTVLVEKVLEDTKVAANADAATLTPETLAKLADTFAVVFREQFQTEPPDSPYLLDVLRHQLSALDSSSETRNMLRLVLGAVEGEYLRRQQGAVWSLTSGALSRTEQERASPDDNLFGVLLNPFQSLGDTGFSLLAVLRQAEGRQIVLANDPASGHAAVAKLSDPSLDRAAALCKAGKAEEAEGLLTTMLSEARHARNIRLGLAAGKLLHDNDRKELLRKLMAKEPFDVRKLNLLGLTYLRDPARASDGDTNPRAAIDAFKNALRCDLRFGPAYLNLAMAYEQNGDSLSARQCLRRYLELMPEGAHAADARRRLGALTPQNVK